MAHTRTHQENPLSADMTGRAALDEVHRRLTSIYASMMEGPFGDRDLDRWVRRELAKLLAEIETATDYRHAPGVE